MSKRPKKKKQVKSRKGYAYLITMDSFKKDRDEGKLDKNTIYLISDK